MDESSAFRLLNEQLILIATVVGAIAALPALIEFWIERRKRQERISLALEDEAVEDLQVRLAGLDEVLTANADVIDAARNPEAYRGSNTGNDLLIIGPPLSGKKSLAWRIAKDAEMDRVVTVYNPRNADALAYAKRVLRRYRRWHKVMLLIPNIDRVLEDPEEEARAELDALIGQNSEQEQVLVVGTATRFAPDTELDDLFSMKIVMPGTRLQPESTRAVADDARSVLRKVAEFYADEAEKAGFSFAMERDALVARVVAEVANAGEVRAILTRCRTSALFRRRTNGEQRAVIGDDDLEQAIARTLVPATAS